MYCKYTLNTIVLNRKNLQWNHLGDYKRWKLSSTQSLEVINWFRWAWQLLIEGMNGLGELQNGPVPTNSKNPEQKYGWFGFYWKCLQIVNKPVAFLVFLCFLVVTQGMIITGITSVIITSIQTRYGFTSVQAGALSSSYDTAYGISSIFVSFFGHSRKPLCLSIGSFVLAIGCLIASFPHFLVGEYHAGVTREIDWCNGNNTLATDSNDCKGGAWYYLAIFCLAYVTMGIGATPIYILGPSHLDESTRRGKSGFYIGIMYAFAALGPAIGYLMGRPILNTYVDISQVGLYFWEITSY